MKVLLVEDHALFLEGIALVLKKADEQVEILIGESITQGLELAQAHPDLELVLLDCHLPDGDGVAALPRFAKHLPNTPLVLLSAEQNAKVVRNAINSGAKGFITKTTTSSVMLSAIQLVMSGGVYLPTLLLDAEAEGAQQKAEALEINANNAFLLTDRQQEVLQQMTKGMSNKEIARELNMSPSTVKVHVAAILREFNVKNRTQAVNMAQTNNLFTN